MKKIFLTFALAIETMYANLQAITTQDFVKEMEQQGQHNLDDYRKQQEDNRNKIRQWLNEHESSAKKMAVDFILKQGYSIQSIKLTQKDADNYRSMSGMSWAYYKYDVVTANTSQKGSLIYITITVKYDKPEWYIDYFRPYTI